MWILGCITFWASCVLLHSLETTSQGSTDALEYETLNVSTTNRQGDPDVLSCPDIFTRFAYERDLCNATNVENFLKFQKAQFTCANRCGQTASYGITRSCACDAVCVAYNDCCRDMAQVCPEIYGQAKHVYLHLTVTKMIPCQDNGDPFAVIPHANSMRFDPDTVTSAWTTVSSTRISTPNKIVNNHFIKFHSFKVVDLTFGVVFEHYGAFESWKVPTSNPRFIPQMVTLDCSGGSTTTSSYSSAVQALQWCKVLQVNDVFTIFHRSCQWSNAFVISCRCENGEILADYPDYSCQGKNNLVSLVERSAKISSEIIISPEFKRTCKRVNVYNVDNKFKPKKGDMTMQITPLLAKVHNIDREATSFSKSNSSQGNITGEDDHVTEERFDRHSFREDQVEFLVELTETKEKRLRCPSLQSDLHDCVLEECAKGTLLYVNPLAQGEFAGRSCLSSMFAVVTALPDNSQVPMCSCVRVMAALTELGIWQVRTGYDGSEQDQCILLLTTLNEDRDYPDTFQRLNENLEADWPFTSTTDFNSEFEEQLNSRLNETKSQCPEENIHDIQVCFYPETTSEKLADIEAGHSVCMTFLEIPRKPNKGMASNSSDFNYKKMLFAYCCFILLRFVWGEKAVSH